MQKTLFRSILILCVVVFSLTTSAESAEKTFTFPNGISFNYPSEYQALESVIDNDMHIVNLMSRSSDSWIMTWGVMLWENQEELTKMLQSPEEFKEAIEAMQGLGEAFENDLELKRLMGNTTVVQEKITVAGKEAFLMEMIMSGEVNVFKRTVMVPLPGNNIIYVVSTAFDRSKIDECRAVGVRIENSLKF